MFFLAARPPYHLENNFPGSRYGNCYERVAFIFIFGLLGPPAMESCRAVFAVPGLGKDAAPSPHAKRRAGTPESEVTTF